MKIRIFFLISILLYSSFAFSSIYPDFKAAILPITPATQKMMEKYTWKKNCPVPLRDLVQIKLSYWGLDSKTHQGNLIVNRIVAEEVVSIFKTLYYHHFPIASMKLIDEFKGSDEASMEANNTSSFNCRSVTGTVHHFSRHSYGLAIDINPLINPYIKGNEILPLAGKKYTNRIKIYPGMITKNSVIYSEFKKHGWQWGGDWQTLKDYQHFEKKFELFI